MSLAYSSYTYVTQQFEDCFMIRTTLLYGRLTQIGLKELEGGEGGGVETIWLLRTRELPGEGVLALIVQQVLKLHYKRGREDMKKRVLR